MRLERYNKFGNKYIRPVKDDWRDRLDIEIGDVKQSTFYPQLKVKRWENEVNFSVRLKDNDYASAIIVEEDDKIKWKNGKREVHFYDIETDGTHLFEDGGYELNVVFLEKPDINIVEFTIETKNVVFYYQPPLTDEQKAEKCIPDGEPVWEQLDQAIGSYAIYHKSFPNTIKGNKLYRCGKIAHIFRPRRG